MKIFSCDEISKLHAAVLALSLFLLTEGDEIGDKMKKGIHHVSWY
jgi:hypothetical protein